MDHSVVVLQVVARWMSDATTSIAVDLASFPADDQFRDETEDHCLTTNV
jgi:hypothetical protein